MAATGEFAAKPKGLSLHIGLNEIDPAHYGGSNGALSCCVKDSQDMMALAKAQGFEVLALLNNGGATRGAVAGAFAKAAARLRAGDIFLFTYSGHGGFVPDTSGDEALDPDGEDDKQDETLCLFDGMLVDDEIGVMWQAFKPGVRAAVLLDCCHSGTGVKAPPPGHVPAGKSKSGKKRLLPTSTVRKTFLGNRAMYDAIQAAAKSAPAGQIVCSVTQIGACQDFQESSDGDPGGNGFFTEQLLSIWNGGAFGGTYKDLRDQISVNTAPFDQDPRLFRVGAPNSVFEAQRPFLI